MKKNCLFSYRVNGRPAIKKNRMMIMGRGAKKWIAPNLEYKAWENNLAQMIAFQRPDLPVITDLLELHISFFFKNHQHEPDLSNCLEGIQDVLQKANVISNDKNIARIVADKFFGFKTDYFTVELYKYGPGPIEED